MSNRTLQQILEAGNSPDVTLVKVEHPDGDVYLWDGLGSLDYDFGDGAGVVEVKGLGRLGSVQISASDTEVQVSDIVFRLSGVDAEHLAYLDATVKGNLAWVWKAFLGPDYRVRFLEQIVECELDQPSFAAEPGGTVTVTIAANGGFYFLETQSRAVWDREEQRNYLTSLALDPDSDTGFDRMPELKNKQINWEQP